MKGKTPKYFRLTTHIFYCLHHDGNAKKEDYDYVVFRWNISRAWICKHIRSPGIDFKKSIPGLLKVVQIHRRYFKTFKEPRNRFQWFHFAGLCSLAGRYDNSFPTRFLTPIDCSTIQAQALGNIGWGWGGRRCSASLETRNRVGIGLSHRLAWLHRPAEWIPWNWFLGSIKV